MKGKAQVEVGIRFDKGPGPQLQQEKRGGTYVGQVEKLLVL